MKAETTRAIDAVKLTEDDLTAVLVRLGETPTGKRNRALVLVMADSALRVAEAVALETRDLVRKAGQLTHVLIRCGKGGKPASQPVTTRTAAAIAEWLEDRERLGIGEGPLFCTISKGNRKAKFATGSGELVPGTALSTTYVRTMVKKAGLAAGLAVDLHPHLLRHWAITRFLRANKDLELARKFARHSDILTTARVYAHLVQEDVDRGMEALPGNGAEEATADPMAVFVATLSPEQKAAFAKALEVELRRSARTPPAPAEVKADQAAVDVDFDQVDGELHEEESGDEVAAELV